MAQSKQKILKNAAKYTKKAQYSKAINEYRKLTQEDYGETSLNNTIGDLLIRSNNIQEAIVEYEKAGKYYEEKGDYSIFRTGFSLSFCSSLNLPNSN